MKALNHKIRIISKNEKELIQPSELLLPLNSLVNLINLLENAEDEYKKYESSHRVNKDRSDFQHFIEFRLQQSRHHIKAVNDNNCVTIKAMSKKSPYWVDLVITASPHVIQIIRILIAENSNSIENEIIRKLNAISKFQELSDADKLRIAKSILKKVKWILTFIEISID
jgi:hypothetical protein